MTKNVNAVMSDLDAVIIISDCEICPVAEHVEELEEELARTEESLEFSEERRVMVELRADEWQERAEKAEEKVAAYEKYRDDDLDALVFEYAYYSWRMNTAEHTTDKLKAEGARNAISYAIGIIYQFSVKAYRDGSNENHMLVEVWGCDSPVAYYHWHNEKGCNTMKFKVNQQ